jgi:hypothetical protein
MSRGRVYGGLPVPAQRCAHGSQDIRVRAAAGGQNLFLPLPIAMSRRLFQRRQCDQSLREQLIDEAFARYLDWLAESEAVNAAYGVWSRAARTDGALPFAAYGAALDREERAATMYRSVIDQVEQLFGGEDLLAGARPEAARA